MNEQGKNEGRNMTETKISLESGWAESDCSINYVDLLSPQGWSRPPGIIHLVPLYIAQPGPGQQGRMQDKM